MNTREILADGLSLGGPKNPFHLTYTDEVSVRRALARLARAYGWAVVREEVVVPGWGRIDLLLQAASDQSMPLLVEIKLDLSRPAAIRRAFQQTDGYGRWWEKQTGAASRPLLTYCTGNAELIESVGDAYPAVRHQPVGDFMFTLCASQDSPAERRDLARSRLAQAERELAIQRRCADLANVCADVYLKQQAEQKQREAETAEALRAMGVDF